MQLIWKFFLLNYLLENYYKNLKIS